MSSRNKKQKLAPAEIPSYKHMPESRDKVPVDVALMLKQDAIESEEVFRRTLAGLHGDFCFFLKLNKETVEDHAFSVDDWRLQHGHHDNKYGQLAFVAFKNTLIEKKYVWTEEHYKGDSRTNAHTILQFVGL